MPEWLIRITSQQTGCLMQLHFPGALLPPGQQSMGRGFAGVQISKGGVALIVGRNRDSLLINKIPHDFWSCTWDRMPLDQNHIVYIIACRRMFGIQRRLWIMQAV